MVDIRGTRKLRLAVALLCEKAGITDDDIVKFASNKVKESAPKQKKTKK